MFFPMNKYFVVAKNTWAEMLAYRLNFFLWRVRSLIFILTFYFLWRAIIPQDGSVFGYSQSQMLTYILGVWFLSEIVMSSRSQGIGEEITNGNLSNYLIKPFNYFLYWFAKDIGDKLMNTAFAVVELMLIFILFHPPFFLQTDLITLFFFLLSIAIGLVLFFFINVSLGMIGFWTTEIWASRFIFFMIFNFFAGIYFPLDILPRQLYSFYQFLPFSYFLYFPLKIYLGGLTLSETLIGIVIGLSWVVIFYFFLNTLWRKGLRLYTAEGR